MIGIGVRQLMDMTVVPDVINVLLFVEAGFVAIERAPLCRQILRASALR
jgi:hypothetical protein